MSCCPPKCFTKSKNASLFSGSSNNPGNMQSPGIVCSRQINNTIFRNVAGKTTIVYKTLNIFGSYSGAPGGSGTAPKNFF